MGVFLDGKTLEGVHDLGGNVWEWTRIGYYQKENFADFPYDPEIERLLENSDIEEYFKLLKDEKKRLPVLRGGSFGLSSDNCRCAARSLNGNPGSRFNGIGFRCARIKL